LPDKIFVAQAGDVTAKRDVFFGGAEREAVIIAVQIAAPCAAEEIDLIAIGTKREAWEGSGVAVELSFIENAVAARCNDGAVGIRNLLGVPKSSVKYQPLTSTELVLGL